MLQIMKKVKIFEIPNIYSPKNGFKEKLWKQMINLNDEDLITEECKNEEFSANITNIRF